MFSSRWAPFVVRKQQADSSAGESRGRAGVGGLTSSWLQNGPELLAACPVKCRMRRSGLVWGNLQEHPPEPIAAVLAQNDESLDQNLHHLLGEEQMHPPDVVEDE